MRPYIVKPNRNRRRYSIEVSKDLDVIVRTPIHPSNRLIHELLDAHSDWIESQQAKITKRTDDLSDWKNPDLMFFHGQRYRWAYSDNSSAIFTSDTIYIPNEHTPDSFIRHSAVAYLPERCLDIAENMNLKISKITVKSYRSCWGLCRKNGHISLNTALIKVPTWVSDYVMVHECAHLVHFDHSSRFWALVDQYCPKVSDAKQWLKRHQLVL